MEIPVLREGRNVIKAISVLPEGYTEIYAIDLQKNKKLMLLVVYMILHELVHGIAMKMCGTKKIKYGFTGMYAFAGSDDYYGKKQYSFIALAPVVLWGVVLAVVNPFVPAEWFWVVYLI